MPAPQASQMKQLVRAKFTSFSIKVPQNWQNPSGDPDAKHYSDAFKPEEKNTAPGAPPLVQPASSNKYHTDTQKMHIDKIGKFLDGISEAICSAWSTWQTAASMAGIVIAGPTASGGQIVGPPWAPLIIATGPKETPMLLKYTTTVANIIGTAWLTYTATIKIPGLPLFPPYSAWPAPVAPPMPNPTPCKLVACVNVDASLQVAALKGQMIGAHGDPMAPLHKEIFEAIADGFNKCFTQWKLATQFTIMGGGPVPTYAPPYVPVGPVVGGVGVMPPGGMI